MEADIAEYDEKMATPGFWDDPEKSRTIIDAANELKETYEQFTGD